MIWCGHRLLRRLVTETASPPCRPIHTDWKALYKAAIFETDRSLASRKAAEAERALLARERELFYAPGPLEDALYALRALRTAWQHAMAA